MIIESQLADSSIRVAADIAQAYAFAEQDRPDVILTDLSMPSGDGIMLTKQLLGNPKLAEVPVIWISGVEDHSFEQREQFRNVKNYIRKPFKAKELSTHIVEAVSHT